MAAYVVRGLRLTARGRFVVAVYRLPVGDRKLIGGRRVVGDASAQFPAGRHDPVTTHVHSLITAALSSASGFT